MDKLKKLKENCTEKPSEKLQPDMTFGEWMDFWYQNYSKPKLRPTTQMGYENAIYKHIISALGKVPLSELNTNDIQQFYAKLKKEGRLIRTELYGAGVSDRTVWACHTRIRTALDRAIQDSLIRTNSAADCKWQQELADRELMLDTLRDVLKDQTASPAQRLFAVATLDYAKGYHVVPSRLQYPDSREDTDLTNLRARFAAELTKAENADT